MPDRDHQASHATAETPLQGWKDISSYLERDARTAQRWEASSGLPVRRHGGSAGSVYAYPSEIEAWRTSAKADSKAEESTLDRPGRPGQRCEPPVFTRAEIPYRQTANESSTLGPTPALPVRLAGRV